MKNLFVPLFVSCFAIAVASCGPAEQESTAIDAVNLFPGETWETSTLEAEGFDAAKIEAFIEKIRTDDDMYVDAFILIRNGKMVVNERFPRDYVDRVANLPEDRDKIGVNTRNPEYDYDHPDYHPWYQGSERHSQQSTTKSVMSAAMGIAMDQGLIGDVDTKASAYFSDYNVDWNDPLRADISLYDLLTMQSGILWNSEVSYDQAENSTVILENSDNWVQFVWDQPMEVQSGTVWEYNDGVSVVLGQIIAEATGRNMAEWTAENLFAPIGISEYHWKQTPAGETDSEGGLYLTPDGMARFGYLFLRNGMWDGKRVISEEWVKQSIYPHVPDLLPDNPDYNVGYGYQWWVPVHEDGNVIVAQTRGFGGQFIIIAPEHDIVAVFAGWDIYGNNNIDTDLAMQNVIIPALLSEGE